MLSRKYYNDYCKRFKKVYSYLKSMSVSPRIVAESICSFREYRYELMGKTLEEAGFIFPEDYDNKVLSSSVYDDLGLCSEGKFLLGGRFVFPVYDMLGNIIALIGWFPDSKKYITTPSKLFSKECLFFGMEQLASSGIGKPYILVEGIFDALSVRSMGFNCVAQMGITTSRYKCVMYSFFNKILSIPDNDEEGRLVVSEDRWRLPVNGKYMSWKDTSIKDVDKLVNSYDRGDVKNLLLSAWREKDRIVQVEF